MNNHFKDEDEFYSISSSPQQDQIESFPLNQGIPRLDPLTRLSQDFSKHGTGSTFKNIYRNSCSVDPHQNSSSLSNFFKKQSQSANSATILNSKLQSQACIRQQLLDNHATIQNHPQSTSNTTMLNLDPAQAQLPQSDLYAHEREQLAQKSQKKGKKWRIPDPDEVFQQLEMEKTLECLPFKKKVEQNIANLAALMEFETTCEDIQAHNEAVIESDRRKTVSVRHELGFNNEVKAIIFQKNESLFNQENTGVEFLGDSLSAIRESKESQTQSQYKIENMVEKELFKDQLMNKQKEQQNEKQKQKITEEDFTEQVLTSKPFFQVIVAACLARIITNDEYRRYKIQLDDNNLVINRKYTIPFEAITKVKVLHDLIRPELKITFLQKKSKESTVKNKKDKNRCLSFGNTLEDSDAQQQEKLKKQGKNVQNVLLLCDGFELIYTLFASIIVRKLCQAGEKIPEPIQVNSFMMKPGISECYPVSGMILKMSRHMKKWEERFGEIKDFKYLSSQVKHQKKPAAKKNEQSQASFIKDLEEDKGLTIGRCSVKVGKIRELWTRFTLQDGKLVVKFFQGREKFELGIPIHNYADILRQGNWLYGLLTVLRGSD